MNRLAKEKSPYLLQHAHNPVDWYAWNDEAISTARQLNKPIFLSVGYSTCHWCHVMERECFEDENIAKIMNESFINVKVDREERPDVDSQFMMFVQATTGSGGWPMSVFLTPELKPFLGGTYFPPKDTGGLIGFPNLCRLIAEKWNADAEGIRAIGDKMSKELNENLTRTESINSGELQSTKTKWIHKAYSHFEGTFDQQYGGFGGAPKFPSPTNLLFLLRIVAMSKEIEFAKKGNTLGADPGRLQLCCDALGSSNISHIKNVGERAQEMVEKTLTAIWRGGIHDHVGLGIHRYSVDRKWHVPHFEKMLYDQGQLLTIYGEAAQLDPLNLVYREAIEDIVSYMRNNLRDTMGGLYCAEDADSLPEESAKEKKEGAFAVWTIQEIKCILPDREGSIFCLHYGVKENGNVPVSIDAHNELRGKNILMEQCSIEDTAKVFSVSAEECKRILHQGRAALASARAARPRPHLDDKIVTSWNALAISGLATAYQATGDSSMLHMAEQALEFIKTNLFQNDTLLRTYREGPGNISGFADDYSLLIAALLDLHNATLKGEYLILATDLQKKLDELFWDMENGGYYSSAKDATNILLRLKDSQDGAEPSTNSVALTNLARLYLLTDEADYHEKFERLLQGLATQIGQFPPGRTTLLSAVLFELSMPRKVTVFCPNVDNPMSLERVREIKRAADKVYSPFKVYKAEKGDKIALQMCRGTVCQASSSDPSAIKDLFSA